MSGETVMPSSSRHAVALDGVRGLAIIAVMLHHFTVLPETGTAAGWVLRLSEFGAHGVDLFFVLSGFLITSQLLGPRLDTAAIGRFYVRRALRIVPLYYAILVGVYVLLPVALRETGFNLKLAAQIGAAGNWPWYASFVSNFRNALDGKFTNPALDVSWSLAIEMQFYLVWPWIIRMADRRTLKRVIWTVILLSPCLRAAAWATGAGWIQILVLPFLRADALLWGAVVAIWLDERRSGSADATVTLGRLQSVALCIAPAIVIILMVGGWNRQNAFTAIIGYSLIALIAAGACARALTAPSGDWLRKTLECRPLVFLSPYAYGLYLVHVPVRAMLRDVVLKPANFAGWPLGPLGGQIAFYVLACAACLLPALACWHLWEKFFVQWGHRLTAPAAKRIP